MIVYRLIKMEGSEEAIKMLLDRSIDGTYQPGAVRITACHIKGGLNALNSDSARKQLEEAEGREWGPSHARPWYGSEVTVFKLPTHVTVPVRFDPPLQTRKASLYGRIDGFPGSPTDESVVAVDRTAQQLNRYQQEAAAFVRRINDLLEEQGSRGPRYEWAADTLNGIRETVLEKGFVTDAQKTAVDNIENARR